MQAVILAAGMGTRLQPLTDRIAKCMVEVNGTSLGHRMLAQLDQLGLVRIVVVVGYKSVLLQEHLESADIATPIEFIENPVFDTTNNIYSMLLAKDVLLEDDTLVIESDLILEDGVLDGLVHDPRPTLALVDKYQDWMDGTVVTLGADSRIEAFVPGQKQHPEHVESYYKTVNLYKFSREFSRTHYVPFLQAYCLAKGHGDYYEQVLGVLAYVGGSELRARLIDGQKWYEVDNRHDLAAAQELFV